MSETKDLVSLSSRMMAAVRAIETQRPQFLTDGAFFPSYSRLILKTV